MKKKKDITEKLKSICLTSPAPKRRKQRPREMEVWLSSGWPSRDRKCVSAPALTWLDYTTSLTSDSYTKLY